MVETVEEAVEVALEVIADLVVLVIADLGALVIEEVGEVLLVVEIHLAEMLRDDHLVVTDSWAVLVVTDSRAVLVATDSQAVLVATDNQAGTGDPATEVVLAVERGEVHFRGSSWEGVHGIFSRLLLPPSLTHRFGARILLKSC